MRSSCLPRAKAWTAQQEPEKSRSTRFDAVCQMLLPSFLATWKGVHISTHAVQMTEMWAGESWSASNIVMNN